MEVYNSVELPVPTLKNNSLNPAEHLPIHVLCRLADGQRDFFTVLCVRRNIGGRHASLPGIPGEKCQIADGPIWWGWGWGFRNSLFSLCKTKLFGVLVFINSTFLSYMHCQGRLATVDGSIKREQQTERTTDCCLSKGR